MEGKCGQFVQILCHRLYARKSQCYGSSVELLYQDCDIGEVLVSNHRTDDLQAVAGGAVATSSATDGTAVAKRQEAAPGRAVSRAEAMRIAQRILERAERERLVLAENEARRGIQWTDE